MSRLHRAKRELELLRRDPILLALLIFIALAVFIFVIYPLFEVLIKASKRGA